ncbi:chromosome segregation protein SMC [Haloferax sp. Atlit-10N]|uniref:archaea-specific SMC-related protein n=1 Tax=Haloferax TaxID=2251 RepID=UPI000678755F|nr:MULTISPECIES: archaea-specific SMC-related protein [Haloferax]RDZ44796.1 chromosome segregation protein SMC [Haloferax sp. Atlit-16N]RDZ48146.1 chromosome segregation protein SMC [Haloferax sp. Atlit-19N]RDZ59424.1 chromosome segregation protein SMC [Haloferax sp. Atlit-10N]
MNDSEALQTATVRIRNIGGIDERTVGLEPGVTVLTGRNATNRTSFLRALMGAFGSDAASLKGDADEGSVELELDGRTYTRVFSRENGGVTTDGTPYLRDTTTADRFAFLLGSNEARRAVVAERDLHDVIMAPVDTDAIEAEIERLQTRRTQVEQQLDSLDSLEDDRRSLEAKRDDLEAEIEDLEAKRDDLEAEIEAEDRTVEAQRENQAALDEVLSDLQSARSDLETVRFRLQSERESVESLREERSELQSELDSFEADEVDRGEVNERIESIRSRIESLNSTISELQTIVQYTEDVLEGKADLVEDSLGAVGGGSVTDQLVSSETITCWTCGTEVDRDQIRGTTDRLREVRDEQREERAELRRELDELERSMRAAEQAQRDRRKLRDKLQRLEDELDRRTGQIDSLTDQREELAERVEALEADASDLRGQAEGDLIELHKELNEVEFTLDRTRDDLASVHDDLDALDDRFDEREELEREREQVTEELEDARTRIRSLTTAAVEAFNEEMETVLDLLGYDNIERVWLEQVERRVREGRRKVEKTQFELHIVRESDSGTVYEDSIDHLSESEREVVGLVFALAGYLVHEVYEEVPFMLLDSVEAIDAERIAALVDHFEQYPTFLVAALLPEDAQALDESYRRVTWGTDVAPAA